MRVKYISEKQDNSTPKSPVCRSTSLFKEKRPLCASQKAIGEISKKIKLFDSIAEDEVASPLEPHKKKTKLDNHVEKKESKRPLEGWQKKLFKKDESKVPVSRKGNKHLVLNRFYQNCFHRKIGKWTSAVVST